MRKAFLSSVFAVLCLSASAQSVLNDFKPVSDSLSTLLGERSRVTDKLVLKSVMKRGSQLDFYFTESLGEYPWRDSDINWFKKELKSLFPEQYDNYQVGEIYAKRMKLSSLRTPGLTLNGFCTQENAYRIDDPKEKRQPVVSSASADFYSRGMSNRTIALWQSHGRYFEQSLDRWEWQRAPLFQTVEDVFTQTFVLPYLVPMLENAGAYVFLPRERDFNSIEIICDNDPSFDRSSCGNDIRKEGSYSETGRWSDAGEGFADRKEYYTGLENPFRMGTARQISCTNSAASKAEAKWRAEIPQRGEYAVYVSYTSQKKSSNAAHYTVHHLGGDSEFFVNQQMGGGTWIYLGTFEFESEAEVTLDNFTAPGKKSPAGSIVTADAVKIGGGMGNIARGICDDTAAEACTSELPRFCEGARYWMQWAGVDSSVWSQNEQKDDYKDDYMARGAWVHWLTGGSDVNPSEKGLGIPCDISFALHSDAGVTADDRTVGTLAIYTLLCDNNRKMANGEDRMTQRQLSDFVQTQVTEDIRASFNPEWSRRGLWDKSYSESRTPGVPALLLEFLSHQNFADMRFGLDPSFRFTVGRAIYKGMLKYLSERYGCRYEVQPLPVHAFSASFKNNSTVVLSWKETADSLEPTAVAEKYILYTRVDNGGFNNGCVLGNVKRNGETLSAEVPAVPGHISSYRIVAQNKGGKSFPSETLSVGIPEGKTVDDSCVLIVNNFTRVSAPTWFDTPEYAGFIPDADSGVPDRFDAGFIGAQYEYRRNEDWKDDDSPGFGASYSDEAGKIVAGNSFDYPAIHGRYFFDEGYPFISCSAEAFSEGSGMGCWMADIICGKQVTVKVSPQTAEKFTVFPVPMQMAMRTFTEAGGNLLVSGSDIATDIWDRVYPIKTDSLAKESSKAFAKEVLGFKWMTNHAGKTGEVRSCAKKGCFRDLGEISFQTRRNSKIYCVETPDGLVPADKNGKTVMRYYDSNVSAAVCYKGKGYKTVCIGFPIETICSPEESEKVIRAAIEWFKE